MNNQRAWLKKLVYAEPGEDSRGRKSTCEWQTKLFCAIEEIGEESTRMMAQKDWVQQDKNKKAKKTAKGGNYEAFGEEMWAREHYATGGGRLPVLPHERKQSMWAWAGEFARTHLYDFD